MMEKKIYEEVKGMTREEKKAFFDNINKTRLDATDLDVVNGGAKEGVENPNSENPCPQYGPWHTSWGYVCDGETVC